MATISKYSIQSSDLAFRFKVPASIFRFNILSLLSEPGRPSSEIFGDKVNHIGKAHRIPFLTPNTPWRFSTPFDRKATKRPHFGRTRA